MPGVLRRKLAGSQETAGNDVRHNRTKSRFLAVRQCEKSMFGKKFLTLTSFFATMDNALLCKTMPKWR